MQKTLSLLLAFAALHAFAGVPQYYVEVPYYGPGDMKRLIEDGFDVGGIDVNRHVASLIVSESDLLKTRALRVLSRRRIAAPDPNFKKPTDIERLLKAAETQYPQLVKVESIGKSVEGRDIWAVNVTAKFVATGTPKPTILFDAMHHAREVMTSEVALDIIDQLTKNYATDAKVKDWVNKYSIWVIPMLNPDGNNKVWTVQSMWRKNTRGGYGVDINRNYPYAWNTCDGSSGSTSADNYRGPSAGSEPETQAIMALVARIQPKFDISYHTYSELVIYPYGCDPLHIPAPDQNVYEGYAREMARRLVSDTGSGSYSPGTSYELLYNVDGGSIDWMYSTHKVMAMVIEVNSTMQGFQPSYTQWRDITVQRQRAGWQYLLESMDGPGIKPTELPRQYSSLR